MTQPPGRTRPPAPGRTRRSGDDEIALLLYLVPPRISRRSLVAAVERDRAVHRLLDQLEQGDLEKVVLTQRNQMRAVLLTLERYTELERNAA